NGGAGDGDNQLNAPRTAYRFDTGNTMIVDTGNNRVIEVDMNREIVWSFNSTDHGAKAPIHAVWMPDSRTKIVVTEDQIFEVNSRSEIVWSSPISEIQLSNIVNLPELRDPSEAFKNPKRKWVPKVGHLYRVGDSEEEDENLSEEDRVRSREVRLAEL